MIIGGGGEKRVSARLHRPPDRSHLRYLQARSRPPLRPGTPAAKRATGRCMPPVAPCFPHLALQRRLPSMRARQTRPRRHTAALTDFVSHVVQHLVAVVVVVFEPGWAGVVGWGLWWAGGLLN